MVVPAGTTINDKINEVFEVIVDFLRIGGVFSDFIIVLDGGCHQRITQK